MMTEHKFTVEDTSHARLQAGPEAVRWFQDARFGMFIHWGVYALLGRGEWVMHTDMIPVEDYEKLPPQFNPVKFDAEAWVALAAEAGQRYITITSKHHDGFCMFDTALTDYRVTKTPFGRDPMAELAEACRRRGLKLSFYYSLLDWHHPDYRSNWSSYVRYYQGHVRELCTKYGEIGAIWFDGYWPAHTPGPDTQHFLPGGSWDLAGTYDLIHELQPNALIGNNHHVLPLNGEDFQMFEQDLPGENTAGFNAPAIGALPLESCLTINKSWGYNAGDDQHKSVEETVRFLVHCVGRGSNLLLNVGPTPRGEIQEAHAERLRGVGAWLRKYGEAIYGTRPGPGTPAPWGYPVQKDGRIYLHILQWPGNSLTLSGVRASSAHFLHDGVIVPVRQSDDGVTLTLPDAAPDPVNTVIVLGK